MLIEQCAEEGVRKDLFVGMVGSTVEIHSSSQWTSVSGVGGSSCGCRGHRPSFSR